MANLKFLQIWRELFRSERRTGKYLLVNTVDERRLVVDGSDGIFKAKDFNTKADAMQYLRNGVAKVSQKDWRLYCLATPSNKKEQS